MTAHELLHAARLLHPRNVEIVRLAASAYGPLPPEDDDILTLFALVLEAEDAGHGALPLGRLHEVFPPGLADDSSDENLDTPNVDAPDAAANSPAPSPGAILDVLAQLSGLRERVIAHPLVRSGEYTPLFVYLPGPDLLLTQRLADDQRRIAGALLRLATTTPVPALPDSTISAASEHFFTDKYPEARRALHHVLSSAVAVITGGPGTGKTYSIKCILAALLENAPQLRIALAAPTGKAAANMNESIVVDLGDIPVRDDNIRDTLRNLRAVSVHSLLRIRRHDGGTRYHERNPLPADVIVIDEASMMSTDLLRKLLDAVHPSARVVFLGDRDQLPSVEAGATLSDMVERAFQPDATLGPLDRRVARLVDPHRFTKSSCIYSFLTTLHALRATDPAADPAPALDALRTRGARPAAELTLADGAAPSEALLATLAQPYLTGYVRQLKAFFAQTPDHSFTDDELIALCKAFDEYRILCTHRRGSRGVSGLNRAIGAQVRKTLEEAWIERKRRFPQFGSLWIGMPVLITQNTPSDDLFNGDVGIALPSGPRGALEVVFRRTTASGVKPLRIAATRLPAWMPAFAMTVHKSQGSAYTHVALVLAGRASPIETRELVYTAITRAKQDFSWVGTRDAIYDAFKRRTRRFGAIRYYLDLRVENETDLPVAVVP